MTRTLCLAAALAKSGIAGSGLLPYTDVQFAPGSKYSHSNPGVIFYP